MNLLDLAISIQEKVAAGERAAEAAAGPSPGGGQAAASEQRALNLREISDVIGQISSKDDVAPQSRLASPFPLCRHVMPSGLRCRSPRLRGSHMFCFYHSRAADRRISRQQPDQRGAALPNLPALEDRAAVRIAIEEIARAALTGGITERMAGVLFYGLQIAMQATPDDKQPAPQHAETNVVEDEELGEYVPLTEEEQLEQEELRESLYQDLPLA